MTLSQIRSQVEALKRKYALELEVYYLRAYLKIIQWEPAG